MVASASSVGVLVIVCTLIGASPPTGTEPTMICRDLRRSMSRQGRMDDMNSSGPRYRRSRAAGKAKAPLSKGLSRLISYCVNGLNRSRGGLHEQVDATV